MSTAYRCCPHCAGDKIHDVPTDGHDLPCDLCAPDPWRERAEKAEAAVERVRELADEWEWGSGTDGRYAVNRIAKQTAGRTLRRALEGAP